MEDVFRFADTLGPAKNIHVHNPLIKLKGVSARARNTRTHCAARRRHGARRRARRARDEHAALGAVLNRSRSRILRGRFLRDRIVACSKIFTKASVIKYTLKSITY